MGYVTLTDFVKKQIDKDAQLIKKGTLKKGKVKWFFLRSSITGKCGASKQVIEYLDKNGIGYEYLDLD